MTEETKVGSPLDDSFCLRTIRVKTTIHLMYWSLSFLRNPSRVNCANEDTKKCKNVGGELKDKGKIL